MSTQRSYIPRHDNHRSIGAAGSEDGPALPQRTYGMAHYKAPYDWSFSFLAQAPESMPIGISQIALAAIRNFLVCRRLLAAIFHQEHPQPLEGGTAAELRDIIAEMGLIKKPRRGNAVNDSAMSALNGLGLTEASVPAVEFIEYRGMPWYEGLGAFMTMLADQKNMSFSGFSNPCWNAAEDGTVQPISMETALEYAELGREAVATLNAAPMVATPDCPAVILNCSVPDGDAVEEGFHADRKNLKRKFAGLEGYSQALGPVYRYQVSATPTGGITVSRVIPDIPSIGQRALLTPRGHLVHETVTLPAVSHVPPALKRFLERPVIKSIFGASFGFWNNAPVAPALSGPVMGFSVGLSMLEAWTRKKYDATRLTIDSESRSFLAASLVQMDPAQLTFPAMLGNGEQEQGETPVEEQEPAQEETPAEESTSAPAEEEPDTAEEARA